MKQCGDKMNLEEIITSAKALRDGFVQWDGFLFSALVFPANVYDAIVIHNPAQATSFTPRYPSSDRSLEEHIALINQMKLDKAIVIAENIDFLRQCPSLRHLSIIPADTAQDGFDFSPLYDLPCILSLHCSTEYGFMQKLRSTIDYSRVSGLIDLGVSGTGHFNFNHITTLKSLSVSQDSSPSLQQLFCGQDLDTLQLIQCRTQSLDGLERARKMQCLYLYSNRYLQNIHALAAIGESLRALRIQNCPRIQDFSVLKSLSNVEMLELTGKNELDNLSFIREMPNLKTLILGMNVRDGDLSLCQSLSWVSVRQMKRHYNLARNDLPQISFCHGNENIEPWRRLE